MKKYFITITTVISATILGQNIQNNPGSNHGNKFEQLGTILPTPNVYRTASGRQDRRIGKIVLIIIFRRI